MRYLVAVIAISLITLPAVAGMYEGGGSTLYAGGFWPTDDDVKNATKNTWWLVGYKYAWPTGSENANMKWVFSAEYQTGDGESGGKDVKIAPVTFGAEWGGSQSGNEAEGRWHFGLGGGAYFADAADNDTAFGGYVCWGYEMAGGLSLDLRYQFTDKFDFGGGNNGMTGNGFVATIGWKFGSSR